MNNWQVPWDEISLFGNFARRDVSTELIDFMKLQGFRVYFNPERNYERYVFSDCGSPTACNYTEI